MNETGPAGWKLLLSKYSVEVLSWQIERLGTQGQRLNYWPGPGGLAGGWFIAAEGMPRIAAGGIPPGAPAGPLPCWDPTVGHATGLLGGACAGCDEVA